MSTEELPNDNARPAVFSLSTKRQWRIHATPQGAKHGWHLWIVPAAHRAGPLTGEGSAEETSEELLELPRESQLEAAAELERKKACMKNSSKVIRSTGLRRRRPCSRETHEVDRLFASAAGMTASCRSMLRSNAT